ncbi:MAG: dTMP kinase [Dehalococcoidia bacterium]|nr:dTMP kinase [Dehalococcoidia bacterium]
MAEGRFIVIEGLDGAGSTTQAGILKNWFATRGIPVRLTWEPTDGPVGSLLRLILAGRVVNLPREGEASPPGEGVLALLFAADRLDHLDNRVLPGLEKGINVISDRYYLSSLAYQTLDHSLNLDWVRQVNARCRRPDLTVYLDVAPAECQRRMLAQGRRLELYEEVSKLERVRDNYLRVIHLLLEEGEDVRVVDGGLPAEDVAAGVAQAVKGLLERPPG